MPSDTKMSNTATREARTGSHPGATGSVPTPGLWRASRLLSMLHQLVDSTVDFNLGSSLDMHEQRRRRLDLGRAYSTGSHLIDWQKQSALASRRRFPLIADVSRELLVQGFRHYATLGGAASSTVAGALALDARGPHNSDDSETSDCRG